jgi:hypothetical protein
MTGSADLLEGFSFITSEQERDKHKNAMTYFFREEKEQ